MSKKTIKLVSILLIAIMAVVALATVVSADTVIGNVTVKSDTSNMTNVTDLGGKIVGLIQVVGTIAAVVILMVVGIKYMMGSAEQKAEYKKTMIPYILGAVLLFTASSLVNIIYNMSQNI